MLKPLFNKLVLLCQEFWTSTVHLAESVTRLLRLCDEFENSDSQS